MPVDTSRYKSQLNISGKKKETQLYSGIAFPFGPTVLSMFGPKDDESVIRSAIENILMTRMGERVMNPSFGSQLQYLVFEQNDQILSIALRAAVQESLHQWEHRVEIGNINVTVSDTTVTIRIPITLPRSNGGQAINATFSINREQM